MNDIQSVNMEWIIDLQWNEERDEMEIDCHGKMKQEWNMNFNMI